MKRNETRTQNERNAQTSQAKRLADRQTDRETDGRLWCLVIQRNLAISGANERFEFARLQANAYVCVCVSMCVVVCESVCCVAIERNLCVRVCVSPTQHNNNRTNNLINNNNNYTK